MVFVMNVLKMEGKMVNEHDIALKYIVNIIQSQKLEEIIYPMMRIVTYDEKGIEM